MALKGSMSKHQWLKLLRGAALSHGEFRVIVMLSTYTDAHGFNAHPGLARLAEDAGVTKTTVRTALRIATEQGWLKLTLKGGNQVAKGLADEYELAVPDVIKTRKGQAGAPLGKGEAGVPLGEVEPVDIAPNRPPSRGDDPEGRVKFENQGSSFNTPQGYNLETLKGPVGVPPSSNSIKSKSSNPLHASDSSNRVDSARPSGPKQASSARAGDQSLWDLGGAGDPSCLQGYTWTDLQEDFDLLEEWLEFWFGLNGFEPSTALGMWESGSHPKAIWNKINADRRAA